MIHAVNICTLFAPAVINYIYLIRIIEVYFLLIMLLKYLNFNRSTSRNHLCVRAIKPRSACLVKIYKEFYSVVGSYKTKRSD